MLGWCVVLILLDVIKEHVPARMDTVVHYVTLPQHLRAEMVSEIKTKRALTVVVPVLLVQFTFGALALGVHAASCVEEGTITGLRLV